HLHQIAVKGRSATQVGEAIRHQPIDAVSARHVLGPPDALGHHYALARIAGDLGVEPALPAVVEHTHEIAARNAARARVHRIDLDSGPARAAPLLLHRA